MTTLFSQNFRKKETERQVWIFFFAASLVSWPVFFMQSSGPAFYTDNEILRTLLNTALMWGPAIGAFTAAAYYRTHVFLPISFAGTDRSLTITSLLLPCAVFFSLYPLVKEDAMPAFGEIFLITSLGVFKVAGEEIGWRGFLQNRWQHLPPWKRYLYIGLLWELWHLHRGMPFEMGWQQILIRKAAMLPLTVGMAFLIGYFSQKYKSVAVAIAIHMWANMLLEFPHPITFAAIAAGVIVAAILQHVRNPGPPSSENQ